MNGARAVLQMALGGAVCGSFLGLFAGGLLGAIVDGCCDNVSIGLDAALWGSGVGVLGGTLIGMLLAVRPGVPQEEQLRNTQGEKPARAEPARQR
jgi:hypothetical protein